jgi:hypothetical protein
MAIQFPPINPGDASPVDGDTYTYPLTQNEYVYNQTENSWAVVTPSNDGTPPTLTIGKITAGANVTVSGNGDLSVGDVEISSVGPGEPAEPPETFWKKTNGILSPKTAADDIAVSDGDIRIDLLNKIETLP